MDLRRAADYAHAGNPKRSSLFGIPSISGAASPCMGLSQDTPGVRDKTLPGNPATVKPLSALKHPAPISPQIQVDNKESSGEWKLVRYPKRRTPTFPRQNVELTNSNARRAPVAPSVPMKRARYNPQPIASSKKQNKGKGPPHNPGQSCNAGSSGCSGSAREIPKGFEALEERLLGLSHRTRSSLTILLQLGGKNKQTITMDEFEKVMKELGMELVNGKGAQFKAKPTIFGPNKPNITFHRVLNLGHKNMVDKGNSFRKSYPDVVRLMEQLWGV
ncbi:hypothetical protein BDV93DRAFT_593740 [Ceratobasidium sp. AG-I]|nr:hypothetical protein BDV93DRAFT_593740 [Ceratobasidium sp. AG-I]